MSTLCIHLSSWKSILIAISFINGLAIWGIYLLAIHLSPVWCTDEDKVVNITQGMNSHKIAQLLSGEKLIRSKSAFLILARLNGSSRSLKAGKYKLNAKLNTSQVLHKLKRGDVIKQYLVIPEGFTIAQIAQVWEAKGLGEAADFEQATRNPSLLQKYHIEASSLEGYLFPNTYEVTYNTTPEMLIERMLREFNRKFTNELRQEANNLELSVHAVVTLASITEKESKVEYEREIISAVFHNRLQRGWKLQADPTVVYALGNPKRNLTYDDLKIKSPYNTYRYKGLPPGPICNPGIASITAAIRPVQTPYMYFVAAGNGTHYFSRTLDEHRNAKSLAKRRSNL